MLTTNAALYLPISKQMLGPVLDDGISLEQAIGGLAVPQVAALVLIQYLPKLREKATLSPDLALIEVIKAGNTQVRRVGRSAFIADAARTLNRQQIQAGHELLGDFRIVLLDERVINERGYLTADGEWDSSFRDRYRTRLMDQLERAYLPTGGRTVLTSEQSRIFREVKAQGDEHLHVQGYAGTGKSYLIKSLVAAFDRSTARVLVLAERQKQLDGLLQGMGQLSNVQSRTFDKLIREMVPPDLTDPANRRMATARYSFAPMPDRDLVRHLGIQPGGKFSALDIARAAGSTVTRFCYSPDSEISARHVPEGKLFDPATKQVVLHHATELWKAAISPTSRDFQPPLRTYHRLKWAALKRWKIPSKYTHVLIDECHDLSKPMLQILDGSSQVVISLGDEYQNLQGRPQRRSAIVRERAVTYSVRSGSMVESVVNPIIAAYPGNSKLPFHGNPLTRTDITYYQQPQVPDEAAVILVRDTWGLFEWAQRLAVNVDFALLSDANDLNIFVSDCVELYQHRTRPRHRELFRFGSWDEVANRHHRNRGFQRIDKMLRKGYSNKDWMKTSARIIEHSARGFALGLIEDVRNREFDTIMLTPEIVEGAWQTQGAALAAVGSTIYVAVTRALRRLIIPEELRNWVEEISKGEIGTLSDAQAALEAVPALGGDRPLW